MKKQTYRIEDNHYKELQKKLIDNDMSFQGFVDQVVEDYLKGIYNPKEEKEMKIIENGKLLELYNEINDLLIESGYEVEWDKDEFIIRAEIEEENGDKDKIYDINEIIRNSNFDIIEFNKKFGYTY